MEISFVVTSAKFAYSTFIRCTGIPKQIGASQCQVEKVKWWWPVYIL